MALNLNLTPKPLKMRGVLICFLVGCTCLLLRQEIARGKKGPMERSSSLEHFVPFNEVAQDFWGTD